MTAAASVRAAWVRSSSTARMSPQFTGKIAKVTIELKEEKRANHEDSERARRAAVLKKALAD